MQTGVLLLEINKECKENNNIDSKVKARDLDKLARLQQSVCGGAYTDWNFTFAVGGFAWTGIRCIPLAAEAAKKVIPSCPIRLP